MKRVRLLLEEIRCRKFQETEKIYILHIAVVFQYDSASVEKAKAILTCIHASVPSTYRNGTAFMYFAAFTKIRCSPTLRPYQKFILSTEIMNGQTLRSYNVSICMHCSA
jgi:hypothetical protein